MKRKTKYYVETPTQVKLPLMHYILLWLFLDKLNVPQWLWGIYWALAIVIFIAFLYYKITVDAKEVDIQDLLKRENEKNEQFKKVLEKIKEDIKNKNL